MTSQVFYRKWRPQTLAEVVGQEHVTHTLLNALTHERLSHAYLFCGPRGTGKTSTGRILAKAVNCLTSQGKGEPCNTCAICQSITEGRAMDVIEVDAASNRGIDEIRDLREKVNYAPNQARYKVYIIDEVHMLSTPAANALLKTLEEPPPHIIFVLATTEAHKILPTILSRCQRFDFRRISQTDVVNKLAQVCQKEGINIESEALKLISRASTGSLRDAENLLQQLATYYGADVKLEQVQAMLGISGDARTRELVKQIFLNDISAGVATINSVNSDGLDLRQFNHEVVEYLRWLLLVKTSSGEALDLTAEDMTELKSLAAGASLPQILKAIKLFGQLDLSLDNYSTLPLELALIDCTMPAVAEKEEHTRPAEPAPQPGAAAPKPAAPPRQKPARAEAAKVAEPAPAASEPAAVKKSTQAASGPAAERKTAPAAAKPAAAPELSPVAESASTIPPKSGSEIERLRMNWNKIINEAPSSIGKTPAAALLRSAKPKEIDGDFIVLSFKYPLHKENMEKLDNQKTAEKIISGFLGRACRVRCVYEPENNHLVTAALRMGARIIDTEEK